MKQHKTETEYLKTLGKRIKLYRVSMGVTQQELGEKSGVSQRSISRLEQGESVQLDNLIKILTALDLEENLELLVPDQTKRPSYYLKEKETTLQRVRKTNRKKNGFQWGDEE